MHQMTVNEVVVDVVRKKIKNLHLTIYPPVGRVRIATPLRVNDETIRSFILSKMPWIKKHREKFIAQKRQSPQGYVSGENHYCQGVPYLLNVIYNDSENKVVIRDESVMDLYVRHGSDLNDRQGVMREWYRQQLKAEIPALIDKWQKIIGVEISTWHIKQMKSRWGTCNIKSRRICLNLELAKKPLHCLEYIVVHELVHLLERSHNARFKFFMGKFMPQWRHYRRELRQSVLSV